jgi:hypothetical protein
MKLLNFSLKIGFRVVAIIIAILLLLSVASKAQSIDVSSLVYSKYTTSITDTSKDTIYTLVNNDTTGFYVKPNSINHYENFWNDRNGRVDTTFKQYAQHIDDTSIIDEDIADDTWDSTKLKTKQVVNDIINIFDQISESDEYKELEDDVIHYTKEGIKTIGERKDKAEAERNFLNKELKFKKIVSIKVDNSNTIGNMCPELLKLRNNLN